MSNYLLLICVVQVLVVWEETMCTVPVSLAGDARLRFKRSTANRAPCGNWTTASPAEFTLANCTTKEVVHLPDRPNNPVYYAKVFTDGRPVDDPLIDDGKVVGVVFIYDDKLPIITGINPINFHKVDDDLDRILNIDPDVMYDNIEPDNKKVALANLLVDGTDLEIKDPSAADKIADLLVTGKPDPGLEMKPEDVEKIFKNANNVFKDTLEPQIIVPESNKLPLVADLLRTGTANPIDSVNKHTVNDELFKTINDVTNRDLEKAPSPDDKKQIVANLLVNGTDIQLTKPEDSDEIADVLIKGQNNGKLDMKPEDVDRILANAKDIYNVAVDDVVGDKLPENEKLPIVADLIRNPQNMPKLTPSNKNKINNELYDKLDNLTENKLKKCKRPRDKKKILADHLLEGTPITELKPEDNDVIADILVRGTANGALGLNKEDEDQILANAKQIVQDVLEDDRTLTDDDKLPLLADIVRSGEPDNLVNLDPEDVHDIDEKMFNAVKTNVNEIGENTLPKNTKIALSNHLLSGTPVKITKPEDSDVIANVLAYGTANGALGLRPEDEDIILGNAKKIASETDLDNKDILISDEDKIPSIVNLLRNGKPNLMSSLRPTDKQKVNKNIYKALDDATNGTLNETPTPNEKKKVLANLLVADTPITVTKPQDSNVVADVLAYGTANGELGLKPEDEDKIRAKAKTIADEVTEDDVGIKLHNEDKLPIIADIVRDGKPNNFAELIPKDKKKVNDKLYNTLDSATDNQLSKAKSPSEKKKILATLLTNGTPVNVTKPEDSDVIADVLTYGTANSKLGLKPEDEDKIRANAKDILNNANTDKISPLLSEDDKLPVLADILHSGQPNNVINLSPRDKKHINDEVFKTMVDNIDSDSLPTDYTDNDKKIAFTNLLLRGTPAKAAKPDDSDIVADVLIHGSANGGLGLRPEDEDRIKANAKKIAVATDDPDIPITDNEKVPVIADILRFGRPNNVKNLEPNDKKRLKDIIYRSMDNAVDNKLHETPIQDDKKRILAELLLRDTPVKDVKPEYSDVVADILVEGTTNGELGLKPEDEDKIRANAKKIIENSLTDDIPIHAEEKLPVIADILRNGRPDNLVDVKPKDKVKVNNRIEQVLNDATDHKLVDAPTPKDKKMVITELLLKDTSIKLPKPEHADVLADVITYGTVNGALGLKPEDEDIIRMNSKKIVENATVDGLDVPLSVEDMIPLFADILRNGKPDNIALLDPIDKVKVDDNINEALFATTDDKLESTPSNNEKRISTNNLLLKDTPIKSTKPEDGDVIADVLAFGTANGAMGLKPEDEDKIRANAKEIAAGTPMNNIDVPISDDDKIPLIANALRIHKPTKLRYLKPKDKKFVNDKLYTVLNKATNNALKKAKPSKDKKIIIANTLLRDTPVKASKPEDVDAVADVLVYGTANGALGLTPEDEDKIRANTKEITDDASVEGLSIPVTHEEKIPLIVDILKKGQPDNVSNLKPKDKKKVNYNIYKVLDNISHNKLKENPKTNDKKIIITNLLLRGTKVKSKKPENSDVVADVLLYGTANGALGLKPRDEDKIRANAKKIANLVPVNGIDIPLRYEDKLPLIAEIVRNGEPDNIVNLKPKDKQKLNDDLYQAINDATKDKLKEAPIDNEKKIIISNLLLKNTPTIITNPEDSEVIGDVLTYGTVNGALHLKPEDEDNIRANAKKIAESAPVSSIDMPVDDDEKLPIIADIVRQGRPNNVVNLEPNEKKIINDEIYDALNDASDKQLIETVPLGDKKVTLANTLLKDTPVKATKPSDSEAVADVLLYGTANGLLGLKPDDEDKIRANVKKIADKVPNDSTSIILSNDDKLPIIAEILRHGKPDNTVYLDGKDKKSLDDKLYRVLDEESGNVLKQSPSTDEKKIILANTVLRDIPVEVTQPENSDAVADVLAYGTVNEELKLKPDDVDKIRANAKKIADKVSVDSVVLSDDDKLSRIVTIMRNGKPDPITYLTPKDKKKIGDKLFNVLDKESKFKLKKTPSPIDKKLMVANLLLKGTPIKARQPSDADDISELLVHGTVNPSLGLKPEDVEKIRANAKYIARKSPVDSVDVNLTDDEKLPLIAEILENGHPIVTLTPKNRKKINNELYRVMNDKSDGKLLEAKSPEDKKTVLAGLFLNGTKVPTTDPNDADVIADVLENLSSGGKLNLKRKDVKQIKTNAMKIAKEASAKGIDVPLNNKDKIRYIARILRHGQPDNMPDLKPKTKRKINDKLYKTLNEASDGTLEAAPTPEEKQKIITTLLLKNTPITDVTLEHSNPVANILAYGTANCALGIKPEDEDKIKANAKQIIRDADLDSVPIYLTDDEKLTLLSDLVRTPKPKEPVTSKPKGREEVSDELYKVINAATDNSLDTTPDELNKKFIIANLLLDGTPIKATKPEDPDAVADVLIKGTAGGALGLTPKDEDRIRANAKKLLADPAIADLDTNLSDEDMMNMIGEILRDAKPDLGLEVKPSKQDTVTDDLFRIMDKESNNKLGQSSTDADKRIIIANLLLRGTKPVARRPSDIDPIVDVLLEGSSKGSLGLTPEEDKRIKENALQLFESIPRDNKDFSDEDKLALVAFLVRNGGSSMILRTRILDPTKIKEKLKKVINNRTDNVFETSPTDVEKKQVIMKLLLANTPIKAEDSNDIRTIADILRFGNPDNLLGITPEIEEVIRNNAKDLYKDDEELESLTDDSKTKLISIMLLNGIVFIVKDTDKIKKKTKDLIDERTNGGYKQAATDLDRNKILADLIINDTSINIATVKDLQVLHKLLRTGSVNGALGITPEIEKQIISNTEELFTSSGDDDLVSLTDDSKTRLISTMLLEGTGAEDINVTSVKYKIQVIINTLADGALESASNDLDKKKVVADLLLKNTTMKATTEDDIQLIYDILHDKPLSNVTPEDQKTIKLNARKFFDMIGDDDLELLTDESKQTVVASFLRTPKSLDTNAIMERVKVVIDKKTDGKLKTAKTDLDKKKVVVGLLSEGTSVNVNTEEDIKVIAEILKQGSAKGALGISVADEDKIKSNAKAIFKDPSDLDLDNLTDESKMSVIRSLLTPQGVEQSVDGNQVRTQVENIVNKITNGKLKDANDDSAKRKVVIDLMLQGTAVEVNSDDEIKELAALLREGVQPKLLKISDVDLNKIEENVREIYKNDASLEQLTNDSKKKVIGSMLLNSSSSIDAKEILGQMENIVDDITNGALKSATDPTQKKKVLLDVLLKDTSNAASNADSDIEVKINIINDFLRDGKLKANPHISEADAEIIKLNVMRFYDNDENLKSLTPNSKTTVFSMMLAGKAANVVDMNSIKVDVQNVIDEVTSGALKTASSTANQQKVIADLLVQGTDVDVSKPDVLESVCNALNGGTVDAAAGLSPDKSARIQENVRNLFAKLQKLKNLTDASKGKVLASLLKNGLVS